MTATRAIHRGATDYPAGLERLKTPPPVLYVRGKLDAFRFHGVAILDASISVRRQGYHE